MDFYKKRVGINYYNEVYCSKLARSMGLFSPECKVVFDGDYYLLSENMNSEKTKFVPMFDIVKEVFKKNSYKELCNHNNMDDIGYALSIYLKDSHDTDKILDQCLDMYLFDIIVGNRDRNLTNYGLLFIDGGVELALIDHESILDSDVVYEDDSLFKITNKEEYQFERFLKIYGDSRLGFFIERIKEVKEAVFDSVDESLGEDAFPVLREKISTFINDSIKVVEKRVNKIRKKTY